MARIRSLKPEFFTSDAVAELNFRQRLLWQGLWCHQDDAGRCKDSARVIKGAVFPLDDDVSPEVIETDLEALHERGRIVRYVVDGRAYIETTNWGEHQHPNRPTPSRLPPPPSTDPPHGALPHDSVSPHRVRREDSLQEGRGVGEGVGGEVERAPTRAFAHPTSPPRDDPTQGLQLCGRRHDPAPSCSDCGAARRDGVTPRTAEAEAKRRHAAAEALTRRAARDACPWADQHDPSGRLEDPETRDPITCDHRTEPRVQVARARAARAS